MAGDDPIVVAKRGPALLADPALNKGTAFTTEERDAFGLHGLLPPVVEDLTTQLHRARRRHGRARDAGCARAEKVVEITVSMRHALSRRSAR